MALVPHGGGAGGSATMAMPMLTADNYTVWAIKAQAILDVHTVWEAVAPGDAAVNVPNAGAIAERAFLKCTTLQKVIIPESVCSIGKYAFSDCPHLCFEADDMDAVMEMLKQNGIAVLDGPNEIPDSERWVYFMDPDYNVLEYIVWLNKEKADRT